MVLLLFLLCAFSVRTQTEINFQSSDSFLLAGTLTLPQGVSRPPVLVLIHGSGPVDRNAELRITNQPNFPCIYPELIGQTSMLFKDIADSLKNAGIAVLRYDKRTTRPNDVNARELTVNHFVNDALAAVKYLRSNSGVDTSRIFILGHSQGSSVASKLLTLDRGIKGVISAAGSTTRIDTLYANQVFRIQSSCNNDSATAVLQRIQVLAAMQQIRAGLVPDTLPVLGAYPKFWQSWMNISDSAVYNYTRSKVPLLVLQGDDDFNVPVEEADRFKAMNRENFDVHILKGINHLFNNGTNINTDEQTLKLIIDFILKDRETGFVEPMNDSEEEFYEIRRERNRIEIHNIGEERLYAEMYDVNGRYLRGKNIGRYGQVSFDLSQPVILLRIRAGQKNKTIKLARIGS